ncbi:MAG: efflux RND transporter periplasmic adaptor subunit [Terriglobia bacterium]
MAPVDPGPKDLRVLQIDRSQKDALDRKDNGGRGPLLYIVLGVVLLAGAVFAVSRLLGNAVEVEVGRPALEPGGQTGSVVLTAGGYIVAHHPIDVSSKVVGKVAWVGVEKGDRVREGQVIVRLEDTEFAAQLEQAKANVAVLTARLRELETGSRPQEIDAAKAAVDQAQANFRNADITLKRNKEMFRQNIASQSQLDTAQMQYDVTRNQLESARKNYELVKIGPRIEEIEYARAQVAQAEAAVKYAQTMLDSTLIRAPVTGTVLERLVEKGEMVSTMNFGGTGGVKASVASIADLNDLQAQLDINQNDFSRISAAQQCSVTADAYPDRVYQGVVAEIAPEANRQKATIEVRVKILHPDAYLRPEMNAHVSFLAPEDNNKQTARDIITIPRAAATQRDGKTVVFVVEGSHARLHEIQAGRDLGDRIEVVDGLSPNDRIVVRGVDGLTSGQRVKTKAVGSGQ